MCSTIPALGSETRWIRYGYIQYDSPEAGREGPMILCAISLVFHADEYESMEQRFSSLEKRGAVGDGGRTLRTC